MLNKSLQKIRSINYHLLVRGPQLVKGAVAQNGVKAYWYRDIVNFGDLITPLLLRKFGFTPVHTLSHKASLVSTGSILEHLSESYTGCILGSGFIYSDSSLSFPNARVLSVRGELTRERLGVKHKGVGLGDPGLLAPLTLAEHPEKKYVLGIVPHHIDIASTAVSQLVALNRDNVIAINVQQQPLEVFKLISQCEYILSSSLHGLIIADAFGIPNAWLGNDELIGGRFKFDDYYSSLGVVAGKPYKIIGKETLHELIAMTTLKPADRIAVLQDANHQLWSKLTSFL